MQRSVINETLTGKNLVTGATVEVSGSGVTVSNVLVVNSTTMTATFRIAANAMSGAGNVPATTLSTQLVSADR